MTHDEILTPEQLQRLARGMHNRAAYHEESASEFPQSKEGEMNLAKLCRAEAHKYETKAAEAKQK